MSQPYRGSCPDRVPRTPAEDGRDPEAVAVYVLLAVLGVTRLTAALALGEDLGAESTVALAMVAAATWGALSR